MVSEDVPELATFESACINYNTVVTQWRKDVKHSDMCGFVLTFVEIEDPVKPPQKSKMQKVDIDDLFRSMVADFSESEEEQCLPSKPASKSESVSTPPKKNYRRRQNRRKQTLK